MFNQYWQTSLSPETTEPLLETPGVVSDFLAKIKRNLTLYKPCPTKSKLRQSFVWCNKNNQVSRPNDFEMELLVNPTEQRYVSYRTYRPSRHFTAIPRDDPLFKVVEKCTDLAKPLLAKLDFLKNGSFLRTNPTNQLARVYQHALLHGTMFGSCNLQKRQGPDEGHVHIDHDFAALGITVTIDTTPNDSERVVARLKQAHTLTEQQKSEFENAKSDLTLIPAYLLAEPMTCNKNTVTAAMYGYSFHAVTLQQNEDSLAVIFRPAVDETVYNDYVRYYNLAGRDVLARHKNDLAWAICSALLEVGQRFPSYTCFPGCVPNNKRFFS